MITSEKAISHKERVLEAMTKEKDPQLKQELSTLADLFSAPASH